MKLFCFAHPLEAKAFLKWDKFVPKSFFFPGLYQSEQSLLLLTGEGLSKASTKLAAVLGAHQGQVTQVLNLGVAGTLREQLVLGEIHSIRTVYGEGEFHSFTSADQLAHYDCLSTRTRVKGELQVKELRPLAHMVDRELWGVAQASSLFDVPFWAYKILSDRPEEGVNCDWVKAQGALLGERLYEYYQSHSDKIADGVPLNLDKDPTIANQLTPEFYFTTSQLRLFRSYLSKLEIKLNVDPAEILSMAHVEELKQNKLLPKKRSALLLENLRHLLTPFRSDFENKLEELLSPVRESGWQVQYDEDLEDSLLELRALIKTQEDVDQLHSALAQFPIKKIQALFEGESHV